MRMLWIDDEGLDRLGWFGKMRRVWIDEEGLDR